VKIRLKGNTLALVLAYDLFQNGADSISIIEGFYYLDSIEFKGIEIENTKKLYEVALPIIEGINAIVLTKDATIGTISLDGYVYQGEGKSIIALMEANLSGQGTLRVSANDEDRKNYTEALNILKGHKELSEASHYLSLEPNYFNLYKAYETLWGYNNKEVTNAVSKNEIERFKQTANSHNAIGDNARHIEKYASPKKPMSIKDAQQMFSIIIKHMLELEIDKK
jgi:hypothetical protein